MHDLDFHRVADLIKNDPLKYFFQSTEGCYMARIAFFKEGTFIWGEKSQHHEEHNNHKNNKQ